MMARYKQGYFWVWAILTLWSLPAFAQLDNRTFSDTWTQTKADSGTLKLEIPSTFYFKNNEYFNKITDGYTLFGWQALPRLSYQFSPNFRLAGGILVQQDFGADTLRKPATFFSGTWQPNSKWSFTLGSLEGALAHKLIEPMFDFERTIIRKVENGLQIKYNHDSLTADVWLDWMKKNLAYSANKEQLFQGSNIRKAWRLSEKNRIAAVLQSTFFHNGGQLDTAGYGSFTKQNLALGFQFYSGKWRLELYGLESKNLSGERAYQALDNGKALYTNLTWQGKHLGIMASHFIGNYFQSALGGQLYQAQTTSVKQPISLVEGQRHLFFLRFMYNYPIGGGASLTLRAEPYYDFVNHFYEYSYSAYFNVPFSVFLKRNRN